MCVCVFAQCIVCKYTQVYSSTDEQWCEKQESSTHADLYERLLMGGSGNEIPASIATAVHSALLTNHPDILQQQFVVHASKVGVGNLCTFESSNPEDKRRFLCLGATVLNKSDLNKFLGFEQTARGAPRNQVNRLDADKRKGSRPRVWSSKHNPGETTKTTGFSKLVIFAAIKHFWDNKQTHETLTGIHCRCFKSYCNSV